MSARFEHWVEGEHYKLLSLPGRRVALFIVVNHSLFQISAETAARLRAGVRHLNLEECEEWNALADSGLLADVNTHTLVEASPNDGANLAINLYLTTRCNLACAYCFARGRGHRVLDRDMDLDTIPFLFDFVRKNVTPSKAVRLEFFGGEPLLNLDFIRRVCDAGEVFSQERGVRLIKRISTNMTHLPEAALRLLARHKFIVSVSVDGGRTSHNQNRPGKNGRAWFDKIIANCRRLREASPDLLLVARMTVNGTLVPLTANVCELWQHDIFDYFQIWPAISVASTESSPAAEGALASPRGTKDTIPPDVQEEFSRLVKAYPFFFSRSKRFRGILEYERIADMALNGKVANGYCSAGRNYFTFSPNGAIYPCHRFVGDTRFQVGDVRTGLTEEPITWRQSPDQSPACRGCWIRYICNGGCKHHNLLSTGDITVPDPSLCRLEMGRVMGILSLIAEKGGDYQRHSRAPLDDLFVSCGRPILPREVAARALQLKTKWFTPLGPAD
ncbi:MAG: SPASM domain-containing protein [Chloroflexi bacterium]|nr:SPASM domain-containing protein [Chloroflexota bacterium]